MMYPDFVRFEREQPRRLHPDVCNLLHRTRFLRTLCECLSATFVVGAICLTIAPTMLLLLRLPLF
jgi:hypothetical protein